MCVCVCVRQISIKYVNNQAQNSESKRIALGKSVTLN